MIRRFCRTLLPLLLLVPLFSAHTGGWAVITVEDLPDYVVAQQPFQLAFTVRQHGTHPLDDVKPSVEVSVGKQVTRVAAKRGSRPGQYVATITMPEPGDARVNVYSGFYNDHHTKLMPLRVTGAGALNAPNYTPAERGHRLFVAKGCLTCHQHRDVPESGAVKLTGAVDLSEPRLAPEFLAKFLANPSIRPSASGFMPNLGLKEKEIAALVAFLNKERK